MTRFSTVNADTLLMVESLNRKNEKTNKLIKYFNSVVADKIWLYHAFSLFLYSITNQSNEMKRLLTWLLVVGALLPAAAQQITEQDKEHAAALV